MCKDNLLDLTAEDFIGIIKKIDSMRYIDQEISDDFFEKFDPENEKDSCHICYEFRRARAKVAALSELLWQVEKDFEGLGITR